MTYSYDSHTVDNDMTVSKPVAWQDIWCLLSVVVVLKMVSEWQDVWLLVQAILIYRLTPVLAYLWPWYFYALIPRYSKSCQLPGSVQDQSNSTTINCQLSEVYRNVVNWIAECVSSI